MVLSLVSLLFAARFAIILLLTIAVLVFTLRLIATTIILITRLATTIVIVAAAVVSIFITRLWILVFIGFFFAFATEQITNPFTKSCK